MKRLLALVAFAAGLIAVVCLTDASQNAPVTAARYHYDEAIEAWSKNDYDKAAAQASIAVMRMERGDDEYDGTLMSACRWLQIDSYASNNQWHLVEEISTKFVGELERQLKKKPGSADLKEQLDRARARLEEAKKRK